MYKHQVMIFLIGLLLGCFSSSTFSRDLVVRNSTELEFWLNKLQPGDTLILAPGDYRLKRFTSAQHGSLEQPIRVQASDAGKAHLRAVDRETFVIRHSHWQFIGLSIIGNDDTEHAFHISGDAKNTQIINCRIKNFDNHIKVNGVDGYFPDNLAVTDSELFNETPRSGTKPSSAIDIIGAKDATIRRNFIHDFGNDISGIVSYGLFLKGGAINGRIEQNLIICSRSHQGIRAGISLGAGGTAPQFCRDRHCDFEHHDGLVANNIITSCTDAGIHLRKANRSQLFANTLVFTAGIDIDPETGPTHLDRNYIGGALNNDSEIALTKTENLVTGFNWLGYNAKMHRWFDGGLATIPNWLQSNSLGLGHKQISQDFLSPQTLNLTPNDIDRLTAKSKTPTAWNFPIHDYWGNLRSDTPWIGAIDYSRSSPIVVWSPSISSPKTH